MTFHLTECTATRREIKDMTRKELVAYLESRGFQCYDYESTKELRVCALEDARLPKATK